MSAERLREAADRLDEMAVALEAMHIRVAANPAALLRAVDRWDHDTDLVGECYSQCRLCAALALADTILGVEDDYMSDDDCECICHEPTTDLNPHDGKCRCNGGTGYEAL